MGTGPTFSRLLAFWNPQSSPPKNPAQVEDTTKLLNIRDATEYITQQRLWYKVVLQTLSVKSSPLIACHCFTKTF